MSKPLSFEHEAGIRQTVQAAKDLKIDEVTTWELGENLPADVCRTLVTMLFEALKEADGVYMIQTSHDTEEHKAKITLRRTGNRAKHQTSHR